MNVESIISLNSLLLLRFVPNFSVLKAIAMTSNGLPDGEASQRNDDRVVVNVGGKMRITLSIAQGVLLCLLGVPYH